jgi:hypothetical protein
MVWFLRPFASMMERIETRYVSAIALKVSPRRTRYFTNAVVGGGAVAVDVDVAGGSVLVAVGRGVDVVPVGVGSNGGGKRVGVGGTTVRVEWTAGTGD